MAGPSSGAGVHRDIAELIRDLLGGERTPGIVSIGKRRLRRMWIRRDRDLITFAGDLDPCAARLSEFEELSTHGAEFTPTLGGGQKLVPRSGKALHIAG